MNYSRDWSNSRNAVGFAAECARLALPFYDGNRRSNLVAAIEIAERYANGEQIDSATARAASNAASSATAFTAADAADTAAHAADAAAYTAYAAYAYTTDTAFTADAADAADASYTAAGHAAHAGVDSSEIQIAFARWVIRDLSGNRDLDEELRQAAGAAVVAGDEALAQELLQ